MKPQKRQYKRPSRKMLLAIIGFVLIGSGIAYAAVISMIPVNGKYPVFGMPEHAYIMSKSDPTLGNFFASKGTTSGKKSLGSFHVSPEIHVRKGMLGSLHFINEDGKSKHNLNIDEFNVHTNDLGYFQTQIITFIADKTGTYRYYCSLHPEMHGVLIVE